MANEVKTTKKRPVKPFKGDEGKTFDANYQPSGHAKSEGWKKLRAERLLTQGILNHLLKGKNMESYIASLYTNARKGNAKAIETINKGIEDDVIKIAATDSDGNDLPINFILDERYKKTGDTDNSGIPT